jgi:hypothetical protein
VFAGRIRRPRFAFMLADGRGSGSGFPGYESCGGEDRAEPPEESHGVQLKAPHGQRDLRGEDRPDREGPRSASRARCVWLGRADENRYGPRAVVLAQVKVCLFFFLLFSFQTPFILDLKI